jgi:uncharacterized Fe-S center protein
MKPEVFYVPLEDGTAMTKQVRALKKIYEAVKAGNAIKENDFVAIKVHVGEKGNKTHMKPQLIKALVDKVREASAYPFLTETSTLYKGERENAVKHILQAHAAGFGIEKTGAPFIMADGLLGNTEYEVPIKGELFDSVKIAGEIKSADAIFAVAHATGHIGAGLGAAIKTLGMGLASRMGKMRQHSSMKPEVNRELCRFCKKCIHWCPRSAIIQEGGKALIIIDQCIGCGECLAVCRYNAIKYDFATESGIMQKSMAEYALGVVQGKEEKCFYFNLLVDMTKDCDCFGTDQEKIIKDMGILASKDPVAIDRATLDLTLKANGKSLAELSYSHLDPLVQIAHGEKIGLGSQDYRLVTL